MSVTSVEFHKKGSLGKYLIYKLKLLLANVDNLASF